MHSTYPTPTGAGNPWQLGPTASRVARWIFGLGFFSVHLGVFLIGGLALLMFNLYRSPNDLWVGGPLVRWGIVVFIHFLGAVITWALTTAFDAAEATRREAIVVARPPRPYAPIAAGSPAPAPYVSPAAPLPPGSRFRPELSTPVEAPPIDEQRRFGFRGRSQEAPPPSAAHRASPPGWTVVRSEPPAPATAPIVIPTPPPTPAETPAVDTTGDNRWTWVEAAAEAWLADRLEKPTGSSPDDGEAS